VAGGGQRFPGLRHGDAEVHQLHSAARGQDDVRGLHVAVEDAGGVGVLERGGEGREGGKRLRDRQGPALQPRLQGLAVRQLHGQVGKPEDGILPHGHDAHDGRVAERAQGLRFADEPHARFAVRGGLEDLERRDHAVAHHGVHAVDRAHPALAEAVLDDPIADAVAGSQHPFTVRVGKATGPRTAVAAASWWSGAEASWRPAGAASSAEATDAARPRAPVPRSRGPERLPPRVTRAPQRRAAAPTAGASPSRARRR
jgi:hypothetical protein